MENQKYESEDIVKVISSKRDAINAIAELMVKIDFDSEDIALLITEVVDRSIKTQHKFAAVAMVIEEISRVFPDCVKVKIEVDGVEQKASSFNIPAESLMTAFRKMVKEDE